MKTSIRAMTPRDLGAVPPLLEQLGYQVSNAELARRFQAVRETGGHLLLVAEREERITGFLHAFARPALEKPPEVIVQAMAVDKAARRGGIGKALLAAAEDWARKHGYASVALSSQVDRADAHAFYQAQGYARVATSGLLRKNLGG